MLRSSANIASPRKACATSGEIFPGVAAATDGVDDGNGSAKRRLRNRTNLVDVIIIARCVATTDANTAPL